MMTLTVLFVLDDGADEGTVETLLKFLKQRVESEWIINGVTVLSASEYDG